MSSSASSEPSFTGGGRTRTLIVRRVARARAMRLTIDPRDGAVRLTLPPRAALRPALAWAEGKRPWIEATLATVPADRPIVARGMLPFEGVEHVIDWDVAHGRRVTVADGRLIVGGPIDSLTPRVVRWLRAEALVRLAAETRALAGSAGLRVARVGVGDPRSRWGSCTTSGDIRYSWRLILAPAAVREATVAHEVAHLIHMDHSAAFHAAVANLLGREPAAERAWLKAHGAGLHRVGAG